MDHGILYLVEKQMEHLEMLNEGYRTHHGDFRAACVIARDSAKTEADASYWQHRIDTLDNIRKERIRKNISKPDARQSAPVPTIGQPWPEQGGIYIGTRLIDGQAHHVIIPGGVEHDIVDVEFRDVESKGAIGELNGHSDWRAPDQEDLMLAWINAREHFVQALTRASIYWSRSEHHGWPWAVDFVHGFVDFYGRSSYEFRVRPFRSFPL